MTAQKTTLDTGEVRSVPVRFDYDDLLLPDNARRFHEALSAPKTLRWMEGEHTQFLRP